MDSYIVLKLLRFIRGRCVSSLFLRILKGEERGGGRREGEGGGKGGGGEGNRSLKFVVIGSNF